MKNIWYCECAHNIIKTRKLYVTNCSNKKRGKNRKRERKLWKYCVPQLCTLHVCHARCTMYYILTFILFLCEFEKKTIFFATISFSLCYMSIYKRQKKMDFNHSKCENRINMIEWILKVNVSNETEVLQSSLFIFSLFSHLVYSHAKICILIKK